MYAWLEETSGLSSLTSTHSPWSCDTHPGVLECLLKHCEIIKRVFKKSISTVITEITNAIAHIYIGRVLQLSSLRDQPPHFPMSPSASSCISTSAVPCPMCGEATSPLCATNHRGGNDLPEEATSRTGGDSNNLPKGNETVSRKRNIGRSRRVHPPWGTVGVLSMACHLLARR